MAITRRQFVSTLGALAAAAGIGQADLSSITEAFGHGVAPWNTNWTTKPKVVWVHGAECTGCSTSLLSFFEDARGTAVEDSGITTAIAVDLAIGGNPGNPATTALAAADLYKTTDATHPLGHRTLRNAVSLTGTDPDGTALNSDYAVNIADVLIDVISLEYHETVMAMGGDLAYKTLLADFSDATDFVLVVEGAVQDNSKGGYWKKTGATSWCSIGMNGADGGSGEHHFDDVVTNLAKSTACLAVVAIGQCATFGGYPACRGKLESDAQKYGYDINTSQTGAQGVYDFLLNSADPDAVAAAAKVVNVPGCPTNPWWFVLTVVAWLVDAVAVLKDGTKDGPLGIVDKHLAIKGTSVDSSRRLYAVYGYPVHSGRCPRFADYSIGKFASRPGDAGCLMMLGCKGPMTKSLCPRHGWNNQQPQNGQLYGLAADGSGTATGLQTVLQSSGLQAKVGGYCVTAGSPCMGCTEKGYPDVFVPFVSNR